MKKWKDFLIENKKKAPKKKRNLIKEFKLRGKNSDGEFLQSEKEQEKFSIAYEIELESHRRINSFSVWDAEEDEPPRAYLEAERDLAAAMFDKSGFVKDALNMPAKDALDSIRLSLAQPLDFLHWYLKPEGERGSSSRSNDSMLPNVKEFHRYGDPRMRAKALREVVLFDIAFESDKSAWSKFLSFVDENIKDPLGLFDSIFTDPARIQELSRFIDFKKYGIERGDPEKEQMSIDFEPEPERADMPSMTSGAKGLGGSELKQQIFSNLSEMPKNVIKKIFSYFVYNLDSKGNGWPEAKNPISLVDIYSEVGKLESLKEIANAGIDGIAAALVHIDHDGFRVGDLIDHSYNSHPSRHVQVLMEGLAIFAREWANFTAETGWDMYERDPVDYLDQEIGGDWRGDLSPDDYAYKSNNAWKMLREFLPNFMDKYGDNIDVKEDGSLPWRSPYTSEGMEFTMEDPRYLTGITSAFEFLDIFWKDFNNQDNFYFSKRTGLHTNVGYLIDGSSADNYNLMKALLAFNHDFALKNFLPPPIEKYFELEPGEEPSAQQKLQYSDLPTRKGKDWARNIKQHAVDYIFLKMREEMRHSKASNQGEVLKHFVEKEFEELNKELSKMVWKGATNEIDWGKNMGFNIAYIEDTQYVEFRYPGTTTVGTYKSGKEPELGVSLEGLKEATLYYCYIVKQAADPEYKEEEYKSDLIGFINNLQGMAITRDPRLNQVQYLKKGDLIDAPAYGEGFSNVFRYIKDTAQMWLEASNGLEPGSISRKFQAISEKDKLHLSRMIRHAYQISEDFLANTRILEVVGFDRVKNPGHRGFVRTPRVYLKWVAPGGHTSLGGKSWDWGDSNDPREHAVEDRLRKYGKYEIKTEVVPAFLVEKKLKTGEWSLIIDDHDQGSRSKRENKFEYTKKYSLDQMIFYTDFMKAAEEAGGSSFDFFVKLAMEVAKDPSVSNEKFLGGVTPHAWSHRVKYAIKQLESDSGLSEVSQYFKKYNF